MLARLVWAAAVLLALWSLAQGLVGLVYFEPTGGAPATARRSGFTVLGACATLAGCSAAALLLSCRARVAVAVAVAVPVVVCGGLALLWPESLLPRCRPSSPFPWPSSASSAAWCSPLAPAGEPGLQTRR